MRQKDNLLGLATGRTKAEGRKKVRKGRKRERPRERESGDEEMT